MQLYLDENVAARSIRRLLTAAETDFRTHDDFAARGKPDVDWIPAVTAGGLIIVTSDFNLRYNQSELTVIKNNLARVIVIRISRTVTVELAATNLVNSLPAIADFDAKNDPPWLTRLQFPNERDFSLGRPGKLSPNKLA